ncbi:glycosyltransferase domain-containing protein [Lelliottia amnigena]|uniref:Glycosyltransferase domain-containing protein n=1 Tax=Lelliottia amnigena TaxID=61646 RepID=A0ABU7UBL0_LELAM
MPKKIVVYTALFGGYDSLTKVPTHDSKYIDFICFTDVEIKSDYGWKIVKVEHKEVSHAMANRYYKFHPHVLFPDYEASLYVDANIQIISNPYEMIKEYIAKSDFVMPKHAERDCLYAEAKECVIQNKEKYIIISKQIKKYNKIGMPKKYGLGENNILIRKHNNPLIIAVMEQWWSELINESQRDQLSLAYVMWKNGLDFVFMTETSRNNNPYFSYQVHKKYINRTLQAKLKDRITLLLRRIRFQKWCV